MTTAVTPLMCLAGFEAVKTELLARNPFRESEYFKRFLAGSPPFPRCGAHQ